MEKYIRKYFTIDDEIKLTYCTNFKGINELKPYIYKDEDENCFSSQRK